MAFNDVVRHVILRITVDQENLAAEIAKAKAALKALKDKEREENRERIKSSEAVTKGIEAQNKALAENAAAHDTAAGSRSRRAADSAQGIRDETKAITENTREIDKQTVAGARADAIERKSVVETDALKQTLANKEKERQKQARNDLKTTAEAAEEAIRGVTAAADAEQERIRTQAEITRNERLGGQTKRATQGAESQARVGRTEGATENARLESAARTARTEAAQANAAAESAARIARTKQVQADSAAESAARAARTAAAQQNAEAESRGRIARADAAGEQKLEHADVKADDDHQQRRIRNAREELKLSEDLADAGKRGRLIEERTNEVIERRIRSREREVRLAESRRRRDTTLGGALSNVLQDATVLAGRAVFSAPRAAAQARRADPRTAEEQLRRSTTLMGRAEDAAEKLGRRIDSIPWFRKFTLSAVAAFNTAEFAGDRFFKRIRTHTDDTGLRVDNLGKRIKALLSASDSGAVGRNPLSLLFSGLINLDKGVRTAHAGFNRFFSSIPRSAEDAGKGITSLGTKVRAFFGELNRSRIGGGGGLFKEFFSNFDLMGQKLAQTVQGMGTHLFSFQTAVLAVVAALGPLAAMLGAVGAAALGLASNIVALSGVLYALPGILGAVVGGFGALALVMKPLSNVFSAYSAAQKEAAKNSQQAAEAATTLRDAQLGLSQAQRDLVRAEQDAPRSVDKLAEARLQATRKIEDYRLALQKLKFDEEGAALGAESAELAYRKSLVDPTKTNLDRRVAQHEYQGALFDQRDQQVTGRRLKEDASRAFRQGVEGSDEVVSAYRAWQDATDRVAQAHVNVQKAQQQVAKAQQEVAAGGGTATQEYQRELDKLPPKTRKVVLAIIELKEEFEDFRNRLSESIFGPLSTDTERFGTALKILETFLGPVGTALGTLADKALDLFTSPEWKTFFSEQGEKSGQWLGTLGQALLDVADAFRSITEIARPFTDFVVGGIGSLAKTFKEFTASKEGREQIAHFLDIAQKRMSELWPITQQLTGGFVGFFNALNQIEGDDFTGWFNEGLLKAATTFNELGKKAQDPNGGFQKWLRDVKPLLSDVGHFLGELLGSVGKLFADNRNIDEARRILQEITEKWLPRLVEIFGELSESGLISKFAKVISSVLGTVESLLKSGFIEGFIDGVTFVFGGLATIFEKLSGWLAKMSEQFPAFGAVVKTVGGIVGAVLATAFLFNLLKIADKLTGISRLFRTVKNIIGSITGKGGGSGGGSGSAGTPTSPDGPNKDDKGYLSSLKRIEKLLQEIRNCICKCAAAGGTGDKDDGKRKGDPKVVGSGPGGKPKPTAPGRPSRDEYPDAPKPGKDTGYGPVGPAVVPSGVDSNSAVARDIRKKAAEQARQDRLARGSTPLNRSDAAARATIDPNGPEGIAARKEAVQKARDERIARGSTPLGDVDTIATGPNSPTGKAARREAVEKARQERLAREAAKPKPVLGPSQDVPRPPVLGPSQNVPRPPVLGPSQDVPRPPVLGPSPNVPRPPVLGPSQDVPRPPQKDTPEPARERRPDTYGPLRYGDPDKKNTVPLQSQLRDRNEKGHFTPSKPEAPITAKPWVGRDDTVYTTAPVATAAPPPTVSPTVSQIPTSTRQQPASPMLPPVLSGGTERRDTTTTPKPAAAPSVTGKKPLRWTQFKNAVRNFDWRDDSGSIQIAPERSTRRSTSTTAPTPSKTRAPSVLSSILSGADAVAGDNDYEQGYEDGLRAATTSTRRGAHTTGSRGGRRGTRGRLRTPHTGRRPVRRGARTPVVADVLDGGNDYEEGYEDGYADALGGASTDLPDGDRDKKKPTRKERRQQRRQARQQRRRTRRSTRRGGLARLLDRGTPEPSTRRRTRATRADTGDDTRRTRRVDTDDVDEPRRATRRAATTTPDVAEKPRLAQAVRTPVRAPGVRPSFLSRVASVGSKGLRVGGPVALAATIAAQVGGGAAVDKFVKDDEDKASLHRGLGAVATGAGIGSMIGSVIPGVGTAIGGVVGGALGGAYSLVKDKNLRSFVGDKISSGAKKVSGFVSGLFGGDDDDDKAPKAPPGGGSGKIAAPNLGTRILDSLKKAGKGIGDFFTKTIPGFFDRGVKGIVRFFTETLPGLPKRAINAIIAGFGFLVGFFTVRLPKMAREFFTEKLPELAGQAWDFIVDKIWKPFKDFITVKIPKFFTETIPKWFDSFTKWRDEKVRKPLKDFITVEVPKFFTETIPKWFEQAPKWINDNVAQPLKTFFTETIPKFFTEDIPNAIKRIPDFVMNTLVKPTVDFFKGVWNKVKEGAGKVWDWAKGLFSNAGEAYEAGKAAGAGKMSGGLIEGVYQGIQDTINTPTTPGEFVVRKSKVDEPGAKAFLRDFNEGRVSMADLYKGLSAASAPQVMSLVPPEAQALTRSVPTVVNNTTNHAPLMGDVTINNPVREKSDHSLRRQVQIAAMRHRR